MFVKLLTPFMKQCWVCAGVALNVAQAGFGFGIVSAMVPELRSPGSPIPIDEECGSWIVSIMGITLIPGNIIGTIIMGKYGRKPAHLICIFMLIIGWVLTAFATNVPTLLIARSLKGISFGIIFVIGPILVGEYTSPTNRGVLLMSLGVLMAAGVLVVLAMSLYIPWKTVSLIYAGVGLLTLVIVLLSPESPSWLAVKGRYEECITSFRWLRGENEEEELDKLVKSGKLANETSSNSNETLITKFRNQYDYLRSATTKVEFYVPMIIMFHINMMAQWSGVNLFSSYAVDLIQLILGNKVDVPTTIIWLNLQRTVSTILFMIVIKKVKRRTVMIYSACLNIIVMVLSGLNSFARSHNLPPFDSVIPGYIILHLHIFSIATGAIPLGYILAGEVYPLQFKSLAGGISSLLFALQIFISMKTVPFLFSTVQLYGAYWLYASAQLYCLVVLCVMLPETKDKTLQDIEEEFRSRNKHEKVTERYTSKPDLF